MSDPKKPDDQEPVHGIAAATLVCGIIDGTYESIEEAQIALERSRRALSKRRSSFNSQPAANDVFEPSR